MKKLTKKCINCNKIKSLDCFYKQNDTKDKLHPYCKQCKNVLTKEYYKTKNGLISKIYNGQLRSCKCRKMKLPQYTKNQLHQWIISQYNFEQLYQIWVDSNYNKWLSPSVDRINDYKSYTFDNIQLINWKENHLKASNDRKSGKNNKQSQAVLQFDMQGNFIKDFYSIAEASRQTGATRHCIRDCCNNKPKYHSAKGFKWKYKS